VKRIKYVSQFAGDLDRAQIDDLVAQATQKNARLGITGILMSSGRLFYQVIEGPTAHVDGIFDAIVKDGRHKDVLLLEEENDAAERFFPDWSMRKVDLDEQAEERLRAAREMLVTVIDKRLEVERLTRTLERAIWFELATALE
jgi:adenylate cyclase